MKILPLVIVLVASAGCAQPYGGQMSAEKATYHDEKRLTLQEGERVYVPLEVLGTVSIRYSFKSDGGLGSIYFMEASEAPKWATGGGAIYYYELSAENTHSNAASTVRGPGQIAFGMSCMTATPCKTTLIIDAVQR